MQTRLPTIASLTPSAVIRKDGKPRPITTYRAARREMAKVVRALHKPERTTVQPTLPVPTRRRLPTYLEKNMPKASIPGGVRRRLATLEKVEAAHTGHITNLLELRAVGQGLRVVTNKALDIILARKA